MMASTMSANTQMFTSSPTPVPYLRMTARTTPTASPISGPTYGMMFRMPAMKAMPRAFEKPSRAMIHRPRKSRRATPVISISRPTK